MSAPHLYSVCQPLLVCCYKMHFRHSQAHRRPQEARDQPFSYWQAICTQGSPGDGAEPTSVSGVWAQAFVPILMPGESITRETCLCWEVIHCLSEVQV